MSGDKEQEYFSDGLAEEIINALTQIHGLRVTARTSGFAFRGKEQDIRKIADALNVRTILEGSVRKSGNRIRVTAQLVSAVDGYHLWSERYDRDMTDVFAIQDEISQAIAEKLRVRLSGDRPLIKHHTENVEAYNLYLKGRYQLLKFTPESMARSREYYEQAIRLDPNYAPAWSGLADFYHRMGFQGLNDPHTAHLQSKEAVMKALGLDESLPEAHSILAVLHADEFNWTGAEGEFLRALDLDPKSEEALAYYGFFCLLPMGRLDEAIDVVKGALELNPLAPFLQFHIGFYYFLTKQHDRAVEHAHNALELDPHFYQAHMLLGMSFTETLQYDEAIQAFEMAIRLGERAPTGLAILGWAYAKAGRIEEARALLTELRDISKTRYIPPCCLAWIHLGLGEIDLCLDWLHKAAEVHDNILFLMLPIHNSRAEPSDPLRSHPRYHALLRKMNLEA